MDDKEYEPSFHEDWQPLPEETALELISVIAGIKSPELKETCILTGRVAGLPFYKTYKLLNLRIEDSKTQELTTNLYALWNESDKIFLLSGISAPVHEINEAEEINLGESDAANYLRFFMFAVRGEDGAFILVEKPIGEAKVDSHVKPLSPIETDGEGRFVFDTVMVYGGVPFTATLVVYPTGEVEMTEDEPIGIDVEMPDGTPPIPPPFDQGNNLHHCLHDRAQATVPVKRSEKPALHYLVELLLEQALQQQQHHRLLDSFNKIFATDNVLVQFATLMSRNAPVVVVESELPFVEEVIADVIRTYNKTGKNLNTVRAQEYDDGSIGFNSVGLDSDCYLMPLQVYSRVQMLDRVAHEIALKDHPTLIACNSFNQLPEALRELADITLRLPRLNPDLFRALFNRVMGQPLPIDWAQQEDVSWVRYLLHTDFEHPRRMGMTIEDAFDYIRAQVRERLASVDPGSGMRLDELRGLREARQHAIDLIADIHAAIQGGLPWTQVDRGMLLVGAPGTGKTTLASAIARECGIKFIKSSASTWGATGDNLYTHLQGIRDTFAEARRYAPSILFIDEIDSLGSRERFSGQNAQYWTEVVNAVLEQMQGIDSDAPVFVIAATNFEENVDPALKRAGRLDRVIRIPRPDSKALSSIYYHYLKKVSTHQPLNSNIDTHQLGRYSLGLTGADVEQVVRGAARRARKKDQPLAHADLFDELTHKPRTGDGLLRMSPEEVERTAQHEAGHALAMYLSASEGRDIGYVTIIPREDGTLGFVARLPDVRTHLTRRGCEQWLEVALAGRAAEELRYGLEEVSGGCANDLEQATYFALRMITRLGLGPNLVWREEAGESEWGQAESLLNEAYSRVLDKLRNSQGSLDRLAAEIVAKQDLDGDEVRAILGNN